MATSGCLLRASQAKACATSRKYRTGNRRLVGERLHDPDVVGNARFWLGYASLYQGSLLAAKEEFDHACRLSADARCSLKYMAGSPKASTPPT